MTRSSAILIIKRVQPVISAKQAREIDRRTTSDFQIPSLRLMQSAAAACFSAISDHFDGQLAGKRVQVLCGPGNNGGDGAGLAALLSQAGAACDVVLFGRVTDTKGDGRTNFDLLRNKIDQSRESGSRAPTLNLIECATEAAWQGLSSSGVTYDVIVDALFGTGLSRALTGIFSVVVEHLNAIRRARDKASSTSQPLIVSIDLPSGLNSDSAVPIGPTIHADLTVTFTAAKPANVLPPAAHLNGKLLIADIGSSATLVSDANPDLFVTEETDAREWLIKTRYTPASFKNTHGHVLVIAGSRGFTGAAVLCGNAAMRSGAGLVTIATPASAQNLVAAGAMPEVMTTALAETDRGAVSDKAIEHVTQLSSSATVIAVGPGLSAADERTRRFVYAIVKQRTTPVVIDADGLNCLASFSERRWPAELEGSEMSPLILTPHHGEMLRLLGTTNKAALDDRVSAARDFATRYKLILVLKGERALIAAPDGRVIINPTGNAGLGTAGAGDTLTGIIAAFVAQDRATLKNDADAFAATVAALYVGGLAGDFAARDLGMRTMVASDIREHISEAVRTLDPKGEQPNL